MMLEPRAWLREGAYDLPIMQSGVMCSSMVVCTCMVEFKC
jgi:hypothetical protein